MKVLLGLSGGVDSAVAAYLLKAQGYDVTCCFMRNWDSFANNDIAGNPQIYNDVCPQEQDYMDAKAVAEHLDLPLERVDFIEEYWNDVFSVFLKQYQSGRTPNPDILCNKYIKFDAFYRYAMEHGFDAIATGHYCDRKDLEDKSYLAKAADNNKDQTYFLAQVPKERIAKTLFPLGKLQKRQVRSIASDLQLDSVKSKKDSTGICFIGERNFRQFLSNYLPAHEGKIVDIDSGQTLGKHNGVLYYTIGQRKGLNITEFKGPWFVAGKDVLENILYVARVDHQHWLQSDSCLVKGMNWMVDDPESLPKKLHAKFRYRQPDQDVELTILEDGNIRLDYPQKINAVTAGQEAVLYVDDICVGGGEIDQVFIDGEDLNQKIIETAAANQAASNYE